MAAAAMDGQKELHEWAEDVKTDLADLLRGYEVALDKTRSQAALAASQSCYRCAAPFGPLGDDGGTLLPARLLNAAIRRD